MDLINHMAMAKETSLCECVLTWTCVYPVRPGGLESTGEGSAHPAVTLMGI